MKPNFEAVKEDNGPWTVKTRIRKNGHWYTIAETSCIPGFMDAETAAKFIAEKLNERVAKMEDFKKIMRRKSITIVGKALSHKVKNTVKTINTDPQTEGWVKVIQKTK